jgi:hypothetical protein
MYNEHMLRQSRPTVLRVADVAWPVQRRRHGSRTTLAFKPNATNDAVQILRGQRAFVLKKPIDLDGREVGGKTFVGYAPLRLEGWGDDKLKALESFAGQFAGMWDWIATTPDRNLTPGARKLKRVLASLVERAA